jgi:hypothetical protein
MQKHAGQPMSMRLFTAWKKVAELVARAQHLPTQYCTLSFALLTSYIHVTSWYTKYRPL